MAYCLHKVGCKDCPEPKCTQTSGWTENFESSPIGLGLKITIAELNEKIALRKSKMSLNEAIEHAENVARTCDISACAEEHMQLAEWLKTLKRLTEG